MKTKLTRPDYLLVGYIVKPHGVRGEVGVKSLTEHPGRRFRAGSKLLAGSDTASLRPCEVESARPFRQGYLVRFSGVTDRDTAESLRGLELYIPASEVSAAGEDEYYHHDLIGMAVEDERGRMLGKVGAVIEVAPYGMLEVEKEDGGSFLLPLVDEMVSEVDTDAEKIRVVLPEGLMEL